MVLLTTLWFTDVLYIFLIIFIILTIFVGYMSRNFFYWRKRGVTQITPVPLFGNFAEYWLKKKPVSPGQVIKRFYDQYENLPYIGFYAFDKPCLLLRDPEIIKKILVKNFFNFSDKFMQSSAKDPLSNRSLPFLKYPEWNNLRQRLNQAFCPGKLKIMFHDFKEVTRDLDNYLDTLALEEAGNTINIKEICARYTTDIIGLTGFGLKLNSLSNPKAEFRKYGKMMFGDYNTRRSYELTSIYLAPPFLKNFFDWRFFEKQSGEFFKKNFEKLLNERITSEIVKNDLAHLLIQIKNEDETMSINDIISQAIVFFTAAFDTTSTVMSFCLLELANNLNIQNQLRDEIQAALAETSGNITYEMLTFHLPYLEKVVSETLRLHPTVPTIDRIATNDFTIEETGLIIEKGTPIIISLLGLHYDPKYFENPEVFNPENFSGGSKNPAYMPFGIGPRSCIASRLGITEVKYGIANIISKYFVTLSASTSVEVDPRVYFTSGKEGLYLHLQKIDTKH